MATLYRWTRLFGWILSLGWGFSGAYWLTHLIAPHHHVLVIVGTVVLGLVFSGVLETVIRFVIDAVFAFLVRWVSPVELPESPSLGQGWNRRP